MSESPWPVGVVPVEGRGALPFALLHGESLVAVASWALGEAGVRLCDYNASWSAVRAEGGGLVVHDPLCPATPVAFLVECIEASSSSGRIVVGVRPVTDTVKALTDEGLVGGTLDRTGLLSVASPVVLPAVVVESLPDWPNLDDLAALVAGLRTGWDVELTEAPPAARRVADESDLRLLEVG